MMNIIFTKTPTPFLNPLYSKTSGMSNWYCFPENIMEEVLEEMVLSSMESKIGFGPLSIIGHEEAPVEAFFELKDYEIPVRSIISFNYQGHFDSKIFNVRVDNIKTPWYNISTSTYEENNPKIIEVKLETNFNDIENEPILLNLLSEIVNKHT